MTMKQTSVVINVDKWNTLKSRGYKLQDIVDTAFNNLLDINLTDNLELNKEKNDLKDKKNYLLQDLEEVEKEYNKKINVLKNEIKDIDFKIRSIEETIINNEKQAEEDKKLSEEKLAYLKERNIMYGNIYQNYINYTEKNPKCIIMDFISVDPESKEYCNKYDISLEDLQDKIQRQIIGID